MDFLDDILDGVQDSKQTIKDTINIPLENAAPVSIMNLRSSKPMTVLSTGRLPVVVEDPVRFRKDLQEMVMMQMVSPLLTKDQFEKMKKSASMIEIATINQLMKAADGNIDSFKYIMDRVLGKPINQTNTVSMTVSYEQMLEQLNVEEEIKPKQVFSEEL